MIQTAPITMLYLPNRVGVKCPDVGSTPRCRPREAQAQTQTHTSSSAISRSPETLLHHACILLLIIHPSPSSSSAGFFQQKPEIIIVRSLHLVCDLGWFHRRQ